MREYLKGECQEDGPGSAQWCPDMGQEAKGRKDAQEVPCEHEEELLPHAVAENWD